MEKVYKNCQRYAMPIEKDEAGGERWKFLKTKLILAMIYASTMASAQYYPQDSILFEIGTVPVKIDATLPSNIWQIGTPQKAYLNAAWSQPDGIITDTATPYPINTYSIFSFVINSKSLKQDFGTYLGFMHKFDTDTLADQGIIEASCDGGAHWCALDNNGWTCPDGPAVIAWDQDSSVSSHQKYYHLSIISGKSDGWMFSRCHLYWIVFDDAPGGIVPDSVMVRFIFTSDGIATGKDGWLVDNIVFGYEDYFTGVSETQLNQHELAIFPNPVTGQSVIRHQPFAEPVTIYIFDCTGRMIRQEAAVEPENLKINRQEFTPGIYLMKIEGKQGNSRTTRFIVQ